MFFDKIVHLFKNKLLKLSFELIQILIQFNINLHYDLNDIDLFLFDDILKTEL